MIENAAQAAGMPVGPLALTDETAVDLAQKIMKQTIRDLGEKAVDPAQMQLIDTMVDTHGRFGRKNGKGFYDYPAKPAKKSLWPGLKDLYPQKAADEVDFEELQAAPAGHHRAGGRPRHGRGHRHRSARGRCRLDPRPSASRPIPAARCPTSTAWARPNSSPSPSACRRNTAPSSRRRSCCVDMAAKGETFYQRFDPYAKGGEKQAA